MKIQIRKVNGVPMGRPVNPFNKIVTYSTGIEERCIAYENFEQSVTEHEAPGFEEGEAEGDLIAQYWAFERWNDGRYPHRAETRQIWRIVPAPEAQPADICVGQWISVKDRLPESDTEVNILLADNRVRIATFIINNGFKSFYCAGGINISYGNVISWQPLPSPPTH